MIDMNIMMWNCRGASSLGFTSLTDDLAPRYLVKIVVLFETHVSGPKTHTLIKNFNFHYYVISDRKGFSGGIWVIWSKDD